MDAKRNAAIKALEYVKNGMVLGLGSGSTSAIFVDLLGDEIKNGRLKDIVGVCTSEVILKQAKGLGIPVSTLDEQEKLDLAVDGADEVDADLQLIKGLGRALLREKMVEIHADKFVVIVDKLKMVEKLGTKGPLPVEIVPFGFKSTLRFLSSLDGCRAEHWMEEDGSPAKTDNGNFLVKLWFDCGIDDPRDLAHMLEARPGVVAHGLFLNMASTVIVGDEDSAWVIER